VELVNWELETGNGTGEQEKGNGEWKMKADDIAALPIPGSRFSVCRFESTLGQGKRAQ
jgi:hypothetical protein